MSCDEYPVRTKQTKNNLGRELLVYAVYKCFTIIIIIIIIIIIRLIGNACAVEE